MAQEALLFSVIEFQVMNTNMSAMKHYTTVLHLYCCVDKTYVPKTKCNGPTSLSAPN